MIGQSEIRAKGVDEGKLKAHDSVWGGSIAAGTIYPVSTGKFRFEVEYTKNADAEKNIKGGPKMKVKTQAALFNVYFDLDLQGMPYLNTVCRCRFRLGMFRIFRLKFSYERKR